jgi:hypothetical protein
MCVPVVSVHDVLTDSDDAWILTTLVNGRSLQGAVASI